MTHTLQEILSRVDHTLLRPDATEAEIKALCADAARYHTASVCVPPSYVSLAAEELTGSGVMVCTVIGFPNGYHTTETKCYEAAEAVMAGADEVDMVVNLGWVKDGRYDQILREISDVKRSAGKAALKVIVETCLLTEEEKIRMCEVVSASSADFIKTSTGFSKGGATPEDIALFKAHVSNGTKIKAAGGIASLEDADRFLTLGADRLGTSRIVRLVKEGNLL